MSLTTSEGIIPHGMVSTVEKPRGSTVEEIPQSEMERLANDWQKAIEIAHSANQAMVDRDYAVPEAIVEEGGEFKELTNPAKIVAQEGPFHGKSSDDPEVIKEAKRREGLMRAFNILYAVQDTIRAAKKAVEEAFNEAKKKRLEELTKKARETNKEAPEVQELPAEEEAAMKAKIEEEIIKQYFDEEKGVYYRLVKGKPDQNQPVNPNDANRAIYEEVLRVSKLKGADGKPTKEAEEAQKLLETLKYNEEENKFVVRTKDQLEADEDREALKKALERTEEEAKAVIRDVLASFDEKTDETIKSVTADPVIASLEIFTDGLSQAKGEHRNYLLYGIYTQLKLLEESGVNLPETVKDRLRHFTTNKGIDREMDKIKGEFFRNVVAPMLEQCYPGWRSIQEELNKHPEKVFSDLIIGIEMGSRGGIDRRGIDIDKSINNLTKAGLIFSQADRSLIKEAAKEQFADYLSGHLENMGLSYNDLKNPKGWAKRRAKELVEAVSTEEEKKNTALIEKRAKIIGKHCDINLETVRSKPKLSTVLMGMGGLGMLLVMLQGTLQTGSEQEREGGH